MGWFGDWGGGLFLCTVHTYGTSKHHRPSRCLAYFGPAARSGREGSTAHGRTSWNGPPQKTNKIPSQSHSRQQPIYDLRWRPSLAYQQGLMAYWIWIGYVQVLGEVWELCRINRWGGGGLLGIVGLCVPPPIFMSEWYSKVVINPRQMNAQHHWHLY